MRVGPWNIRSLRLRAILVVGAVTLAPLFLVSLASWLEGLAAFDLVRTCERVATSIFEATDRPAAARALAKTSGVRVRFLRAEDTLLDADHDDGPANMGWIGGFFFGPDGAPSLATWESSQQRPPHRREEVRSARETGAAEGCAATPSGPLLVCYSARRVPAEDGPVIVYVQQSRPRAIRALYDLRYQLLKLTLLVLPGALLLAWWLGWRMILPVEKLRKQVDNHLSLDIASPNLRLRRRDEFGELAAAFNGLLGRIDERSKENEAFVADLAHEFKNPVAAIRAAAESLETGAVDEGRAQRLSRILRDSSLRLDALVTSLLELARAEAGMAGEEREEVDIAELMLRLVESARADERHAELALELNCSNDARVDGVAGRLETAARNLLENAASYAAQGGGHVRVVVDCTEDRVLLEVSDDGPGIPAEHLSRVFDRFFTTRGHREGTGLGLALVRAVVEAHGGRTSVASEEGGGATFRVELPAWRTRGRG